jgi:hypothetical protein
MRLFFHSIDSWNICVCVALRHLSFAHVWLDALFGIEVVRRVHICTCTCIDALSVWGLLGFADDVRLPEHVVDCFFWERRRLSCCTMALASGQ